MLWRPWYWLTVATHACALLAQDGRLLHGDAARSLTVKLRKKDRAALDSVANMLLRAQAFILNDRTLVCVRKSMKTTTIDLANDQGEVCVSIDKEIGSELTLLHTGINRFVTLLGQED
jgi:hypothetical protein